MDLDTDQLERIRPGMTDFATGDIAPTSLWNVLGVAVGSSAVTQALGRMIDGEGTTTWEITVLTS